MKIDRVQVSYGELRSTGFPAFTNKKIEVQLSAYLETGETARGVKNKLFELAKREVAAGFDVNAAVEDEMDVPF